MHAALVLSLLLAYFMIFRFELNELGTVTCILLVPDSSWAPRKLSENKNKTAITMRLLLGC